ncbi:MAG: hypothetical protein NNA30_05295 [Nitrospira sp.]|nr:hypothetical protein [Nitrospira sp.]
MKPALMRVVTGTMTGKDRGETERRGRGGESRGADWGLRPTRTMGWGVGIRALVLTAILALLASPAVAAPMIESGAGATTILYAENPPVGHPPEIVENHARDGSSNPGTRVHASVPPICFFAPCSGAAFQPGEERWYFGTGAAATARTEYGRNQARVFAGANDNYPSGMPRYDSQAGAVSFWQDDFTLLPLPPGSPASNLEIDFRVDGSWVNAAEFEFLAALTWEHVFSIDAGVSVASYESGRIDESFTLIAPYDPSVLYTLSADLRMSTVGGVEDSIIDLFSTAQVTRILLPPGGAIQSAAGALGNYNVVVVPLPAAAVLFGLGLAGLTGLAARRR